MSNKTIKEMEIELKDAGYRLRIFEEQNEDVVSDVFMWFVSFDTQSSARWLGYTQSDSTLRAYRHLVQLQFLAHLAELREEYTALNQNAVKSVQEYLDKGSQIEQAIIKSVLGYDNE